MPCFYRAIKTWKDRQGSLAAVSTTTSFRHPNESSTNSPPGENPLSCEQPLFLVAFNRLSRHSRETPWLVTCLKKVSRSRSRLALQWTPGSFRFDSLPSEESEPRDRRIVGTLALCCTSVRVWFTSENTARIITFACMYFYKKYDNSKKCSLE